jgi:hypothetical protein
VVIYVRELNSAVSIVGVSIVVDRLTSSGVEGDEKKGLKPFWEPSRQCWLS